MTVEIQPETVETYGSKEKPRHRDDGAAQDAGAPPGLGMGRDRSEDAGRDHSTDCDADG